MRLIKVNAPSGKGSDVAQIAFDVGINQVGIYKSESHDSKGEVKQKESVDIEASTPKASVFLDRLLQSDFYDAEEF